MLELQFFSWHSSKIKLVGAVLFGDLTVRGKRTDGRLCGLRHHSKTSTWRTSDHKFGDTISSWPTWLRATRNKFDEIRLCAFLVGSEGPSSPMSWVASKRIGAHPRRALQERSKDLTASLFDRRSGPGLPLRRLQPSFCSRNLTKATSPRERRLPLEASKAAGFACSVRHLQKLVKTRRDRPI
jgi:hypothetical protein